MFVLYSNNYYVLVASSNVCIIQQYVLVAAILLEATVTNPTSVCECCYISCCCGGCCVFTAGAIQDGAAACVLSVSPAVGVVSIHTVTLYTFTHSLTHCSSRNMCYTRTM